MEFTNDSIVRKCLTVAFLFLYIRLYFPQMWLAPRTYSLHPSLSLTVPSSTPRLSPITFIRLFFLPFPNSLYHYFIPFCLVTIDCFQHVAKPSQSILSRFPVTPKLPLLLFIANYIRPNHIIRPHFCDLISATFVFTLSFLCLAKRILCVLGTTTVNTWQNRSKTILHVLRMNDVIVGETRWPNPR